MKIITELYCGLHMIVAGIIATKAVVKRKPEERIRLVRDPTSCRYRFSSVHNCDDHSHLRWCLRC